MAQTEMKAAKDIAAGEWVNFGSLAWRAGEAWTASGVTYIQFGYSVSEFKPHARLAVHQG
ncbi:hypothetical protein [Streptomyces sp. NBC_01500]|uniref:hypothetical protein n=1 Tax=Streptomyces sp. NBC_01500 TaxID=2903886 RepID=UPI002259B878|nr:hypothetical protein [Streptomyces sp. NBC_01500]MCX4554177.1 hypothetical protein [Streptomyces sp. NBC_01500]MCX4554517.1 hypothetical protein [Streptomyces sp. NBC_01500]